MSLVKRDSGVLESSTVSGAAGKAAVVGGVSTLGVWALAAILPGGIFIWAVILVILGLVFAE